jgi:hypothetical protein
MEAAPSVDGPKRQIAAPSVTQDFTVLQNLDPSWVSLELVNNEGKVFKMQHGNGESTVRLDLADLPAGTYVVVVSNPLFRQTTCIIKM